MEKVYRKELKFVISQLDAEFIKSVISCSCFLDENANTDGYYEVKSIYFDTLSDKFLHETMDGLNVRHKYRIRSYGESNNLYKFEKKMAENGLKCKEVDIISHEILIDLLNNSFHYGNYPNMRVMSDFYAEYMMYILRPVVVIGYHRIPYVYPLGNVRVTFDSNILASRDLTSFFSGYTGLEKEVLKNMVVLEVKYDDILPSFIREVLNSSGVMEQSAFSKYVMSRLTLTEGVI